MKKTFILLLVVWLITLGVVVYQHFYIQEMQYLLDLYEQQPQKIWA